MSGDAKIFWGGYIIGALSWGFLFLLAGIFIGEWKAALGRRIIEWFRRV